MIFEGEVAILKKQKGRNGMKESFFATRMKKLRNQKEITQSELAGILHVSRSCISNYEKGERQPDMEILRRLARYFHVSTDYLLGRPEDVPQEIGDALDLSVLGVEEKLQVLRFYRYLRGQML